MKLVRLLALAAAAWPFVLAQPFLSKSPKVELKGPITKVSIIPGQGMPSLEIQTSEGARRVLLGSMRYLMEKDFNPKTGAVALVKGFQSNQDVYAQRIEIPSAKLTLELRDETGMPLWHGGGFRHQHQRGSQTKR